MDDAATSTREASPRVRARSLGIAPGILPPGALNAITDVAGVLVGHITLIEGDSIRTGATAILPHSGNLYQDRIPAGMVVGNGYGKRMGSTQVQELGEIETVLTQHPDVREAVLRLDEKERDKLLSILSRVAAEVANIYGAEK